MKIVVLKHDLVQVVGNGDGCLCRYHLQGKRRSVLGHVCRCRVFPKRLVIRRIVRHHDDIGLLVKLASTEKC